MPLPRRYNTAGPLVGLTQAFRAASEQYRADYEAARPSRFKRIRHGLYGTADAHYRSDRDYFEPIEYVRDMERNDPLVRATLNIVVNQRVKSGFKFAPNTGEKNLDQDLAADFADWSGDPRRFDHGGEMDFYAAERLVDRHEIRDGDLFVLPTPDCTMQFLEGERCRTPSRSERTIVHGVLLDRETRRRLGYFFTKGAVDPFARVERVNETTFLPAWDDDSFPAVFHVRDRQRITQTRGVSAFTAALLKAGMQEDVEFALLVKQQMAAALAWSEETSVENGYGSGGDTALGARDTVSGAAGGEHVTEEITPGTIYRPPPGKRLQMHSPSIASTETLEHIRRIQQLIGLQVGLPVIVMLMDASETNFSGWRGAVDIARSLWREAQQHRINSYHRPVATFRIRWLMRQGSRRSELGRALRSAAARGLDVFRHTWRPPSWPYVQPLHDAQARALKLSTLQTSPRREAAEDGQDFAEIVAETVADNEDAIGRAIDAAARLNARAGKDVVHWTHLLNRDMPRGLTATDSLDEAAADSAPKK